MKITFELPEVVYHQLKAQAALSGQTVNAVLLEAIRAKLAVEPLPTPTGMGWRSVFGKATAEGVREVQNEIDQEFGRLSVRDHTAFLNSFASEDEGQYDNH